MTAYAIVAPKDLIVGVNADCLMNTSVPLRQKMEAT